MTIEQNLECPQAWQGDGVAVEVADRECVRLLVNCCLYTPPITEEDIHAYAKQFDMTKRQAQEELRRIRYVN